MFLPSLEVRDSTSFIMALVTRGAGRPSAASCVHCGAAPHDLVVQGREGGIPAAAPLHW